MGRDGRVDPRYKVQLAFLAECLVETPIGKRGKYLGNLTTEAETRNYTDDVDPPPQDKANEDGEEESRSCCSILAI